ncbi:hypothetical protein GCAAIG_03675 [Candidatus Electronema halotolerans]|jgi:hypothetical protein
MKKAVIGFTLGIGLALAGFASSAAAAGTSIQDMQNQMMSNMANQMSSSMQNQMMGNVQNQMGGSASAMPSMPSMPSGMANNSMGNMGASIAAGMANAMMSGVSQQVSANVGMDNLWQPTADQQALSSPAPTLDIRKMIEQAVGNMPNQQRTQIADQLTQQNLSMMQQGAAAANQIRNQVRNTIMTDRYKNISSMAPNLYRSNIQPNMVQTIIGNIRPWELPNRFKNQMMPKVVEQVSGQIKMPQINFMQEGIGNAEFPNIPGMPGMPSMSGGIQKEQMQYMQDGIMNSNFPMNMMKK